jgi:hypothetical protein
MRQAATGSGNRKRQRASGNRKRPTGNRNGVPGGVDVNNGNCPLLVRGCLGRPLP